MRKRGYIMKKTIFIGGAWPYANGSLHIGHVAGLVPGDVIARYHRAIGNQVIYVSGSDCHGTPVCIRAKQENTTPEQVSDHYHEEFSQCFERLGFSYDYYGKTSQKEHKEFVIQFHKELYESEYVYEKTVPQAYCEHCHKFLPDRYVVGSCPNCNAPTRGDQCDACGTVLDPEDLIQPICSLCHSTPSFQDTKHLYLAVTKLKEELQRLVDHQNGWRKNAIAITNHYLQEGLCDRALTRDLDWGIEVPRNGYEEKRIYIWAENVLGYLSMSQIAAEQRNLSFDDLWSEQVRHYYVHAKDNIPFHTIILPALLLANPNQYHLPDKIISNEYLTLEGRKVSTSQNWAIWIKDIVDTYHPDALRYFFIANGPEKRDTDFSWNEFVRSNNGELVGAYGNFINRTLVFVQKHLNGVIPEGTIEEETKQRFEQLYTVVGSLIEQGNLKDALELVFEEVRASNKYFDACAPWVTRNTDLAQCHHTIYQCVFRIANLATLLAPFLPFSSEQVSKWLLIDLSWGLKHVLSHQPLSNITILFERIDAKQIVKEREKLIQQSNPQ